MAWRRIPLIWTALAVVGASAVAWAAPASTRDDRLQAARQFVEGSPRYLHHRRLRRGMEGYGLTVLAGAKIVRFKARVVSVITNWDPHRDVILARLSGQNLEHTGIIAGMSGSPVYFRDERDGKDKLVGAVAYGWQGQKDPLTGIQPITQMLAAGEQFRKLGKKPGPIAAMSGGRARAAAGGVEAYLARILDPRKIDFVEAFAPPRRAPQSASSGPRLVPLATPLMVSGASRRTLERLGRFLEPLGLVPVASGGVTPAQAAEIKGLKLEPGSAIAVSLASGDADYTAVGTVTDVVNGHVLAFGHSFYSEGDVRLPMGPAYVHTCVAGLMRSFKLSTGLGIEGTLVRDENVAVAGVIGPKPAMIPMTVTCHWPGENRKETFEYRLADHRYMTAVMARYMLMDSVAAWHEMPERHTVRYDAAVHYDKLGTYRASNVSSGDDVYTANSDLSRPIVAMLNNPYGDRIAPNRIEVTVTVEPGDRSAGMLDLKLRGHLYRPGETVAGVLTIRPYRKSRETVAVQFKLPADMPEGDYTLTVCGAVSELRARQAEAPHRFAPRTTRQIFESIQRVVDPPAGQLYLRVPLKDGGGIALGQRELPDLPVSRAKILADAKILDTRSFRQSLVQTIKTRYLISGSIHASFRVRREPGETLLRK